MTTSWTTRLETHSAHCGCGWDESPLQAISLNGYRALREQSHEFDVNIDELVNDSQPAALFDYQQGVYIANEAWKSKSPHQATRAQLKACPFMTRYPLVTNAGFDASGCPVAKVLAHRLPVHLVICLPRNDRRVLPMRVSMSPILSASGEVAAVVVRESGTDVQGNNASKPDSANGNRLDVLVGGIAHDFNNLLVGILGFASLAEDVLETQHPASPYVAGIRQSAEQAARLTRELMCYALGSSPETEVLALDRIVAESLEVLGNRIQPSIHVQRHLHPDLRALRADPAQIRQVVINVCLNAIESMTEREGTLTIATAEYVLDDWIRGDSEPVGGMAPGHYARLTVCDTGNGIDEPTVHHLFEPYVSQHRFGRGLGLPAVAGIVREHGGAIRVETQPTIGTRFDVFLPTCEGRPETKALSVTKDLPRGTETILILDDEDRVRRMLSGALNRLGYQCLEATNAAEAISIYQERQDQIDLVVLDMVMPDADGEEVFERLRQINPRVRCVLSSGYSRSFSLNRTTCNRLAGFIQKPYNLQTLAHRIRDSLDRPMNSAEA